MLYFAYGSNLNLRGMKRRCPKATPVCAAKLKGYRLEFHTFAAMVPDAAGEVPGALYELTPQCVRALDKYEGDDYAQVTVTVDTAEGPRAAMVYMMKDGLVSQHGVAPPTVQYFGEVSRGYTDWKLDAGVLRRARLATLHPVKLEKRKT